MARLLRQRVVQRPAEDMTAILMIQRANTPTWQPIFLDFWTAAYQAIDD
jgi:hypothetical protein